MLLLSYIVVFLCMMRGVESGEKVIVRGSLYFLLQSGYKAPSFFPGGGGYRKGVKTFSQISQNFALLLVCPQTFIAFCYELFFCLFCLFPSTAPSRVQAFFKSPASLFLRSWQTQNKILTELLQQTVLDILVVGIGLSQS